MPKDELRTIRNLSIRLSALRALRATERSDLKNDSLSLHEDRAAHG